MRPTTRRIAFFFCFALWLVVFSSPALAQTFTVLHTFTGADGKYPQAPLALDRAGNLYGTASQGGFTQGGTAFKLSRRNGSYTFSLLYNFYQYPTDASVPNGVVLAPDGTLYGSSGGGDSYYGTIFRLRPPATICASISCPWTETIVYLFQGGGDGCYPQDIAFDASGDIVGATYDDGCGGHWGTVYELTPSAGGWSYNLLYTFPGTDGEGSEPDSALVIDHAGNLYGTTAYTSRDFGGYGTVYKLAPSGSGWVHNALYTFDGTTGALPYGLILDSTGDLFGPTSEGGTDNKGTLFELTPVSGGWTFTSIFNFANYSNGGPAVPLTMDSQGNLYGETYGGGAYLYGNVFKLTPSADGWTYTDLHDFTNYSDGSGPNGQILIDQNGNLYGTSSKGGDITGSECLPYGCGTVWEIAP